MISLICKAQKHSAASTLAAAVSRSWDVTRRNMWQQAPVKQVNALKGQPMIALVHPASRVSAVITHRGNNSRGLFAKATSGNQLRRVAPEAASACYWTAAWAAGRATYRGSEPRGTLLQQSRQLMWPANPCPNGRAPFIAALGKGPLLPMVVDPEQRAPAAHSPPLRL